MTTPVLTRLLRVLDLEEKQNWRNRSVIGGLLAMGERWREDADAAALDENLIQVILALMAHYETVNQQQRPAVASKLRAVLLGEVDDLDTLLDELVGDRAPTTAADPIAPLAADQAEASAEEADWDDSDVEIVEDEHGAYAAYPPPEPTHVARERVRRQQRQQERANRTPHDLQAAPTILSGVGEATAENLTRLTIHKVVDLLWHLPVRHEDYSQLRTIDQLEPGEQVTIIANLWDVKTRKISMKREMVQGIVADGTGTLHATWWNKYIVKQLKPGSTLRLSGKVGLYMGQKTLDNPLFEDADTEMVSTGRLAPVYALTEGVSQKRLRELIRQALEEFAYFMADPLPTALRDTYGLPDLPTALQQVHFPEDQEELTRARRRLAFEEFLYIQLGVLQRRRELQRTQAHALISDPALLQQFTERLPFALTGAQQRVLTEITADISRTMPMTRLVQGDVGSGKTAVAAGAMWIASTNGVQSALLAPTQILAEQHHRGISRLLADLQRPDGQPLEVALLTGRVIGAERERILAGLRTGAIDIVIGTTALIQEQVEFNQLGFVVVDEQHRFGVEQRGALRTKSAKQPHLLVMSATPIPRSLAMTIYGDLDVSVIDEMPPGRIEIKTKTFRPSERERLYQFLRREVEAGRQAFIVYPLVEESDKLDVGAAVEEHQRLGQEIFPDLRLGLLHGRMSGSEKDEIMRAFAAGEYPILVSTSVIEVGIDVPNASVIVIEDAERFGLAQLHQFRGRVGRGQHASYCALVSKAESPDAQERLRALAETNDGFALAEKDLALRGPGEFLGTKQSGLPELRMAHLSDVATLAIAREAAQQIFERDPELRDHVSLQKQVWRFWRGHGDIN
ncbi:MAG: ATP-dependent DNA helicase RecG [Caldilineaceae bacterium]|nr:ATP-dependent DNA helicase RecG [Caldilineaceae bacterium]